VIQGYQLQQRINSYGMSTNPTINEDFSDVRSTFNWVNYGFAKTDIPVKFILVTEYIAKRFDVRAALVNVTGLTKIEWDAMPLDSTTAYFPNTLVKITREVDIPLRAGLSIPPTSFPPTVQQQITYLDTKGTVPIDTIMSIANKAISTLTPVDDPGAMFGALKTGVDILQGMFGAVDDGTFQFSSGLYDTMRLTETPTHYVLSTMVFYEDGNGVSPNFGHRNTYYESTSPITSITDYSVIKKDRVLDAGFAWVEAESRFERTTSVGTTSVANSGFSDYLTPGAGTTVEMTVDRAIPRPYTKYDWHTYTHNDILTYSNSTQEYDYNNVWVAPDAGYEYKPLMYFDVSWHPAPW
jgi:hypothetical protein